MCSSSGKYGSLDSFTVLAKMVAWIEEVPDLCENDAKELGNPWTHGPHGLTSTPCEVEKLE
jgi:hypothetical protein